MARSASFVFTLFVFLLVLVVTEMGSITVAQQRKTCYVNVFPNGSCLANGPCNTGCESRGYLGGRCQLKGFRGNQQRCFCKLKDCTSE
ncbi:PREDICTED: defensin-like protein [Lupinus angustifolius]|uniref:defensin-like protein n=1 Tax=Lupinus angustifolius TaxID=3871 RepID=UPI00092E279C|nr:PREDICTED: defensin-like protein [Lupinus angustifolius]